MATGKHARFLCDRCGWEYPFLSAKLETGTQIRVCSECYDGSYDRVNHPQNFPPKDLTDDTALPWSRSDRDEATAALLDLIVTNNGGIITTNSDKDILVGS